MARAKTTKPAAFSVFERMALIRTAVQAAIAETETLHTAVRVPKPEPKEWDGTTDLRLQLEHALTALDEVADLLKPVKRYHVDQYPSRT